MDNEKLLLPILRENIGEEKGSIEEFFELVSHTDPRSIVEVDYKKEIEHDLPLSLNTFRTNPQGTLEAVKNGATFLFQSPLRPEDRGEKGNRPFLRLVFQ